MQITVIAEDPVRSADFYCNLLGLFEEVAAIPYGGGNVEIRLRLRATSRCGLLISPGTPRPLTGNLRDLPILSLNIDDWASLRERLVGQIDIRQVHELPYGIQAHVVDPGGNHIVLFEKW